MTKKTVILGGYTRLPNHLIDEHMPCLNGAAWKVVVCVARLTVGWNKDEAAISFATFQKHTGIKSDTTIIVAIKEAIESGAIKCVGEKKGSRGTRVYALMKSQQLIRLEQLQAMPYQEYLQSPEWQERRKQHLKYAHYRCQVCNEGRTELNVHHRTYERVGCELVSDLIVLCRGCHTLFHRERKIADWSDYEQSAQ